jgi:hypothetical protein
MATAIKNFVAIRQKFDFFGSLTKKAKLHNILSRAFPNFGLLLYMKRLVTFTWW